MNAKPALRTSVFYFLFLGLLSAFGPFVMDMYLPALPSMTGIFHTHASMVQLSLTTCMIGLAVGQLFFGPLSDRYGRRRPLLLALALFLLATLGCLFAENIEVFVVLRFVQGFGGAGGVVLSRSIATDRYSGRQLAKMLAIVGAVNGAATVAAPIGGGLVVGLAGWRGVFVLLLVLGTLLLAVSLRYRESLPVAARSHCSGREVWLNFRQVLSNRMLVSYVLQYGFAMGVLFVYISSAPFIMQEHYGLNEIHFSLCFGINATAMLVASTLSVKYFTPQRALSLGRRGMLGLSVLLCLAFSFDCPFWLYEILTFALLMVVGTTFTVSNSLAMDCEHQHAGVASALLGAVGYAFGCLVPVLVGLGGNSMMVVGFLLVGGSVLTLLSSLRQRERYYARA